VAGLDWDGPPVATLTRKDIAAIVRRHMAGLLAATEVAQWANLVECREDIEFEQRHEAAIADALFDLANPDIQGQLVDIGADVLALVEA